MSEQFVIKHKTKALYIHFNPRDENYLFNNELLGACTFTREAGLNFLQVAHLNNDCILEAISPEKVLQVPRSTEPALYDSLH
jgi:hypothetical protein